MPTKKRADHRECIQKAALRGSNFWAAGLRALYLQVSPGKTSSPVPLFLVVLATTLILWIFGPIPMFVGSVATVMILYVLDIHNGEYLPFAESGSCDGHSSEKKAGQDSTACRYKSDLRKNELKNSNPRNSDSKKSNWITTSIGYENHNKKAWAANILEIEVKDRGFAVTVLNGQLSAATTLTSISLTLCALIGVLLGKSTENLLTSSFIFGSTSKSTNSIKYVAILSCFILAFACFVQTTRHFAHASFLISAPTDKVTSDHVECIQKEELKREVLECIQTAVLRGSNFWAVGLRALYFATNLLLWIFGPIPMFAGSLVTVIILYNLDVNTKKPINYGTVLLYNPLHHHHLIITVGHQPPRLFHSRLLTTLTLLLSSVAADSPESAFARCRSPR
ncbi:reverse transcriptase domain, reverse transcriptase zinc-binding domain protein [Tanacetum coccineum]